MNAHLTDEKVKPFRLVKYFTFSSLIVVFLGTIVLSMLFTHWARSMQLKKIEDYALLISENLNYHIVVGAIIPLRIRYGNDLRMSDPRQFKRLDFVVRAVIKEFKKVDTFNVYNIENQIVYSLDEKLLGKENIGDTSYKKALSGKILTKLIQRGNYFEKMFGIPKEIKMVTFVPMRFTPSLGVYHGPIVGVLEISQDISVDYESIFQFQISVIITCSLVMSILFLVLLFVVRRGENIIEKRAKERLKLKEQLHRAEHLSSLGEMIAGISHEIRNPLGIIRSSAELLKKKGVKKDSSNSIPDIIVEEASRLNNIITDFLNFAKPQQLNLMSCNINDIIEKIISFMASQIHDQGLFIQKNLAENLPEIKADSAVLYQAFLNILINSIQAMPTGGEIQIDTSHSQSYVNVLFIDHGGGIPDEIAGKIWDPFFTTKEKGTGLGLGIVKNIIESHHGSIVIQNKNDGACVTIKLPV